MNSLWTSCFIWEFVFRINSYYIPHTLIVLSPHSDWLSWRWIAGAIHLWAKREKQNGLAVCFFFWGANFIKDKTDFIQFEFCLVYTKCKLKQFFASVLVKVVDICFYRNIHCYSSSLCWMIVTFKRYIYARSSCSYFPVRHLSLCRTFP